MNFRMTLVWDGKQWINFYTGVPVPGIPQPVYDTVVGGTGPWFSSEPSQSDFSFVRTEENALVMVATEYGAGAFWLHELKHIEDLQTGGSIVVLEPIDAARRSIRSVWGTGRIIEAINAAVG